MTEKLHQREIVLALLQRKPWVTLPEILDLRIANYRARISELRDMGYEIKQEDERVGGRRHSRYQLVRKVQQLSLGIIYLTTEEINHEKESGYS